jgi:hypothetical protein
VQYEDFANIDSKDATSQSQILDYFIQLLGCYASLYRGEQVRVHFHPGFFILPKTEEFFSKFFVSLDTSLSPTVNKLFQRCYAFIANFIGPSETIPVMQRLLEKLKTRFPHLSETYNKAISTVTAEFFR